MGTPLVRDTSLAPAGARPNVLSMPSSTVSRFVLLVTALLSSGLFVGTVIHNETAVSGDWLDRVRECEAARPPVPAGASADELLLAEQAVLRCVEGVQQRLAWFAIGGVVLTLVAAAIVVAVVPTVIVRRRRLRPAGPRLTAATERVASLSEDSGLRRVPETLVGRSTLRDAFSFGLPGRYAVALPPALAVRSTSPAFEPLVRHELAHVARHDVVIAWSARALWYVVAVLLSLPVVTAVAEADLSLLPSYLWRAALLLAATVLASAGILRSREYDADLGSTHTPAHRHALSALLGTSGRPPATGWRRALALHPAASQRVAVLADPAPLARPSAVDAGIAGFLAAVAVPLLVSLMATVPSLTTWAYLLPAVLVGPVIGATVGLALWRLALVETVTGTVTLRASTRRVATASALGFFVGQAGSLAAVGSNTITGSQSALAPLLGALMLGGATFVVAGLGRLASDRSAHFSARAYTLAALAVSATLFAFVLWASTTWTRALDLGGWSLAAQVAVTVLGRPAAAVVVAALAVAVLLLLVLRAGKEPPTWAVEGELPAVVARDERSIGALRPLAVALTAGVTASVVILTFRLVAGPAETYEQQAQRFEVYVWVFAAAGAAAGIALLLLHGLRGTGVGLLAAPVASATAALGFVVINSAFGGAADWEFISGVLPPGLPLGLLLFVLGSLLASLPVPDTVSHRPLWLAVMVGALLAGTAAVGTIAARDAISPLHPAVSEGMSVSDYVDGYAVSVGAALSGIDGVTAAIDADAGASGPQRARRIRLELVAPLDDLLRQAASITPADEGLVGAHAVLVQGLQGTRGSFETFARAYETGDSTVFGQAQAERAEAQQLLQAWSAEVAARRAG